MARYPYCKQRQVYLQYTEYTDYVNLLFVLQTLYLTSILLKVLQFLFQPIKIRHLLIMQWFLMDQIPVLFKQALTISQKIR